MSVHRLDISNKFIRYGKFLIKIGCDGYHVCHAQGFCTAAFLVGEQVYDSRTRNLFRGVSNLEEVHYWLNPAVIIKLQPTLELFG